MATLNTLRTKGGIIVIIVIGLALLAFLLGDLSPSVGSNPNKIKVGEIDGKKVSYLDYLNRVDYITQMEKLMAGRDNFTADEIDMIRDRAWDELISQYAMTPGLNNLGFTVSETEQIDMVDGNNISPVISQMFADPSTGFFNQEYLRSFIGAMNSDPSGTYSSMWNYIKSQMNRERALSKYMTVVSKGMFVTDLEVEQGMAYSNTLSDIAYVMGDYESISDSTVVVTSAEIKKYYDDHKKLFRQSASRDIEYVVFEVLPSSEDYADAEKHMDEIAREFEVSETPMQYAILNSQSQVSQLYYGPDQMYDEVSAFAFGPDRNSLYGPVMENDVYTMARVADVQMRPDSIGARHILLPAGQNALADSLMKAIRGGEDFARVALQNSADTETAMQGGDLGIFPAEYLLPELANPLMNARVGDIMTVTSQAGIHIMELTFKSKPREKVQLAIINYNVEPSDATQQEVYGRVSDFVSKASANYDAFKNAVAEGALSKRVARVRTTERTLNGMENSREVIRWAFNAKANEVSPILEMNGDYVVASVAAATTDGIAPLNIVSEEITEHLRFEKKGEMLSEKMNGKSLSTLAGEFDTEVKNAAGVDFTTFYINEVGVETKLIGAVSAVAVNAVSKPVKGVSGVYVFEVTGRQPVETATTVEMEKARQQATAESYLAERTSQALLQGSNIKDNRIVYF